MSSRSPAPGSSPLPPLLQRLLPLVLVGITFLLLYQLFPDALGGTPSAAPTATAVGPSATPEPAATPEPDTSTRTRIWNASLVTPLETGLRFLASDLAMGAGTAIILFTIAVRALLLPLSIQQLRSQKKMMALQPELAALKKKYGDDKEKLGVETMALYKQHQVNPAAGCLPILLQMPILFGLYAALNNLGTQNLPENEPFHQPWLWVEHLNQPDVITLGGVTLPFVLPVLAAVTQFVQQRMMTQPTDDPQQRMQNQMLLFMPLMMLWFGLSFSAGLALYWVTQNVVGIVQQYFTTGWGSLLPNRTPAPARGSASGGAGDVARGDGSGRGAGAAKRLNGPAGSAGSAGSGGKGSQGRGGGQRGPGEGRRSSGKR